MLGCKTESSLGVTAALQLSKHADYLDLDGPLDVANDPFIGLKIETGKILLHTGFGLGVQLNTQQNIFTINKGDTNGKFKMPNS